MLPPFGPSLKTTNLSDIDPLAPRPNAPILPPVFLTVSPVWVTLDPSETRQFAAASNNGPATATWSVDRPGRGACLEQGPLHGASFGSRRGSGACNRHPYLDNTGAERGGIVKPEVDGGAVNLGPAGSAGDGGSGGQVAENFELFVSKRFVHNGFIVDLGANKRARSAGRKWLRS